MVFVARHPPNGQVWQKVFFRWLRAQGRTHTRPAFPKMPTAPSAFPSGAGRWTQPPEAEENLQLPRHTRPDPCRSKHGRLAGRSITRWLEKCSIAIRLYLATAAVPWPLCFYSFLFTFSFRDLSWLIHVCRLGVFLGQISEKFFQNPITIIMFFTV